MNSRQRRSERKYEHEVTLTVRSDDLRYLDFDRRVEAAKGWLNGQVKRKMWKLGPSHYNNQTFKFRDGGLASAFALRWL